MGLAHKAMVVGWVALVVVLSACGATNSSGRSSTESVLGSSTETVAVPSTGSSSSTISTTSLAPDGVGASVDVVVTGFAARSPQGSLELCEFDAACFGVVIAGDADESLDGSWVEVVGRFDGVELVPAEPPRIVAAPQAWEPMPALCPGLAPHWSLDRGVVETANAYAASVADQFAGSWIDESGVLTYGFIGDDATGHRDALAEATGGGDVCAMDGFRWTETELSSVAGEVFGIARGDQRLSWSGGPAITSNVVDVSARVLDPEHRQLLDAYGERVRVHAFIELLDQPIEALPPFEPVGAAEVPLLLQPNGGRGGDLASAGFVLRFDEELDCVYGETAAIDGGTKRLAVMWPDGYTATAHPVTVYDFDGLVVGQEGDIVSGGGGYHDTATLSDDQNACGAAGSDALLIVTR